MSPSDFGTGAPPRWHALAPVVWLLGRWLGLGAFLMAVFFVAAVAGAHGRLQHSRRRHRDVVLELQTQMHNRRPTAAELERTCWHGYGWER